MFRRNSHVEKFNALEGGGITVLTKTFCLRVPKIFVADLSVSKLFIYKKG